MIQLKMPDVTEEDKSLEEFESKTGLNPPFYSLSFDIEIKI